MYYKQHPELKTTDSSIKYVLYCTKYLVFVW